MAAAADIDFKSSRLIIQLERNDILIDLDRTHNPTLTIELEASLRDRLLVIDNFDTELQQANSRYAGQRLQQSMYRAMLADTRVIEESRREEQQAVEDRAEAARLNGQAAPPVPEQVRQQQQGADCESERLAEIEETINPTGPVIDDDTSTLAGDADGVSEIGSEPPLVSGDAGITRVNLEHYMNALQLDERQPNVECDVCSDYFRGSQVVQLPCSDTWCRRCLTRQFEEATVNEGVWPPKCCRQDIPPHAAFRVIPAGLRVRFVNKSIEWSTSPRIYCHDKSCSTFIPQARIRNRQADCPQCGESTCAECKGTYHSQLACPDVATEEDRMLEQMARENGWPRCPTCRRYIAITHGCNHMTCQCKTEFCYECSREWKNCECARWHEDRLLENAQRIANRQGRDDVAEVAREIEEAHECNHPRGGWTRTGPGHCDECRRHNPGWLWTCDGCQISVCRRCQVGRVQNRA